MSAGKGCRLTMYRGTRFTLSRDELLTLPEFVLLSLFPNGLLPDGHMGGFHEGEVYSVDVSQLIPFVPHKPCADLCSMTPTLCSTCSTFFAPSRSQSHRRRRRHRALRSWMLPTRRRTRRGICCKTGPASSCSGRTWTFTSSRRDLTLTRLR